MAVELVWTKRAIQGYDRIIKYLEEKWSEKEVKYFVRETAHFFELLKKILKC
jgi:plasmid stabilization system protein ParE